MFRRNPSTVFFGLLVAAQALFVSTGAAEPVTVDPKDLRKLQQIIEQQQKQLDSLQQQVNDLKETAAEAKSEAIEAKSTAEEAVDTVKIATTVVQTPAGKVVTSGKERVKLTISGQVNRAVNIVDDGKSTKVYHVDSDVTNSRVRLVGTAKATEDLTIGSRIEVAIAPNESGEVSQNNEDSGDFFDQRWTEVSLKSNRFGKLSLGKGSTASDNTAEVDLSRTGVIQYAGVGDIAGGLKFREKSDRLTNISVSSAFNNFDGLGRRTRARYDSPTYRGFKIASSVISDQRVDASLWWGGQGYGFKAAGALAIADPNKDNTDLLYDGSLSLLHETTGLNLTLSAGMEDRKDEGDPTNLYAKAGWLTRFFSFGQTGFGLDYTRSLNLPTGKDDGYSVGGAVAQQFEDFGSEVYLQYRLYSVDRGSEPSVQDINAGTMGARVKF